MTYTGNQQHRKRHDDKSYLFLLSIPCGRGNIIVQILLALVIHISTHAPAGGATLLFVKLHAAAGFLLTPLREGRHESLRACQAAHYFYSRPCGRGDTWTAKTDWAVTISTHAPAGGATQGGVIGEFVCDISTHAPAGGATRDPARRRYRGLYFYSRPCGRGDFYKVPSAITREFLLTPLREGRRHGRFSARVGLFISTHAPAGGATAIFHKSVMRFCSKLPKDDTVLCLASFGFPRRDPKAVYLAWISCANLPQKCVREGLALKDQGTSCFHEGLASHAFDPVLV